MKCQLGPVPKRLGGGEGRYSWLDTAYVERVPPPPSPKVFRNVGRVSKTLHKNQLPTTQE